MKTQYTYLPRAYRGESVYVWEPLGRRRNKGREYRLSCGGKLSLVELRQLRFLPAGAPRLLARIRRMTDEWWPVYKRHVRIKGKWTWPRAGTLVPTGAINELVDSGYLETDPTEEEP